MRKALYILGQLTDLDIEWIIEHGRRASVSPGDVLIRQGEPIENLYITLAGEFAIINERLRNREIARLGRGEILGEMSFIDTRPPSATVKAAEPSTVLALSRATLQARLEEDAAFAARFYRAIAIFLSDRLRSTVSRLGYGPGNGGAEEAGEEEDALDLSVLDNVHLAGDRFVRILNRLSEVT